MDILGGADGLAAAWADIFAGAAGLLLLRGIVWKVESTGDGQLIPPIMYRFPTYFL